VQCPGRVIFKIRLVINFTISSGNSGKRGRKELCICSIRHYKAPHEATFELESRLTDRKLERCWLGGGGMLTVAAHNFRSSLLFFQAWDWLFSRYLFFFFSGNTLCMNLKYMKS
jgi:hypothetical protein